MASIFEQAKLAAFGVLPASIAPENQYAKSFAAVLCLAVSADFEFNVEEFSQASQFIEQDHSLRSNGLTKRTIDYFKSYCDSIKSVMKADNIDFPALQTEMIAEVRNVPTEYKDAIRGLIHTLIPVCSDMEQQVLRRIDL